MTFGKSYSSLHAQTGEVDACKVTCGVRNQDLERDSRLEFSDAQDTQDLKHEFPYALDSQGSDLDLTPDAAPTKPNGYQALKPLSLWCTLMIVLYFLQGCFEGGSTLSTIFSALSTASLVLLPVVVAVVAWKYFRAVNTYHKAIEKFE